MDTVSIVCPAHAGRICRNQKVLAVRLRTIIFLSQRKAIMSYQRSFRPQRGGSARPAHKNHNRKKPGKRGAYIHPSKFVSKATITGPESPYEAAPYALMLSNVQAPPWLSLHSWNCAFPSLSVRICLAQFAPRITHASPASMKS